MKTTKIKLENLKVESFVTNMEAEKLDTVNGGKIQYQDTDIGYICNASDAGYGGCSYHGPCH